MNNPDITLTPEIVAALADNSPVAISVSGGKDGTAMAIVLNDYLDGIGHPRSKRCLVHADLGQIEWAQSMEWVEKLARFCDLPLIVCRREKGGMISRWEQRWSDNQIRYRNMELLSLISPWSSATWRFCTSELKTSPIATVLKKRFPGELIINATGIRGEESSARAKALISKPNKRFTAKTTNTSGIDWHPIHAMSLERVLAIHKDHSFPLHPAYVEHGSTRLSCSFCVLASRNDQFAALKLGSNHAAYRRIVDLELSSAYSFQPDSWLAEKALHLIPDGKDRLERAIVLSEQRAAMDAMIPEGLRLKGGRALRMPTLDEAQLLGMIRCSVANIMQIQGMRFISAPQVLDFYRSRLVDSLSQPMLFALDSQVS